MYNDGKKDRGIVIKVCTRMARTGGFAQLASTAHQMRLPFDNDIELTASTVCIITPPPLVRNIGEGRSGPQTVSAKNPVSSDQTIKDIVSPICIYIPHALAVAVIVVELRPGRHYCHAHMHLYIGCCY